MVSQARESFPGWLRWALLGPFGVFFITYLLALAGKGGPESKVLNGAWLVATAGATLVDVIAVPAAIFLLVRDAPRYVTVGNVAMILAAGLPLLVVLLLVLLFSGALGTFHI